MGLFDFFKRKGLKNKSKDDKSIDRSKWTGSDFEFLITGVGEIPVNKYDEIMSPNSFEWSIVLKNNWRYYKVGEDEYSFSAEIPGIQFTFNKEVKFDKAKKIADEIIENLKTLDGNPVLLVLEKGSVYKF